MTFIFGNNFVNLDFPNLPEMQKNQFVELENGGSTDTRVGLKPYFLMYKSNLCQSVPLYQCFRGISHRWSKICQG